MADDKVVSVLEDGRSVAHESRMRSKVIEFAGKDGAVRKFVIREPTGEDFDWAERPVRREKDGTPVMPSQRRLTLRLLIRTAQVADSNGGTVGPVWPWTEEGEKAILLLSPVDPLLMKMANAFHEISKFEALEADATKSAD